MRNDAGIVDPQRLETWMPIMSWDLVKGETARFEKVFSELKGAYVQSFHLKDPYCGVRLENRAHLKRFLKEMVNTVGELENVSITMCALRYDNPNFVPRDELASIVEKELKFLGLSLEINVLRATSFHDREIHLTLVNQDGTSRQYRYDLTGGVDKLRSTGEDSRVFRYEL